jgi:hypothetical protein
MTMIAEAVIADEQTAAELIDEAIFILHGTALAPIIAEPLQMA